MATYTWSAYAKTAKEHSFRPTLPPGSYTGEIIEAGAKVPKSGKPRLSWKFKVLSGPEAGKTETMFQSLSVDNPAALAAFYGVLGRLGINLDEVPDGTPPEAIAKLAIGRRFSFDFDHRVDEKSNQDPKPVYGDFKNLVALDTVVSAQAPASAPAPAAEGESEIEKLKAQLAAAQAAAGVSAAAEAVPAVGGKLPF